jgi:hypothetical protein
LQDLVLFWARKQKLVKNEKILFISDEEIHVKIGLILGQIHKDLHGGDDNDVQVSEVLEVFRKLGQVSNSLEDLDEDSSSIVQKAVKKYQTDMKSNNLLDSIMLKKLVSSSIDNYLRLLPNNILIIAPILDDKLAKIIFSNFEVLNVQIEIPLDASMNGSPDFSVQVEQSSLESLFGEHQDHAHDDDDGKTNTELFCRSIIEGYSRLLINSRDELSLARVISSGPNSVLDHKAFTILKKEAFAR